MRYALLGSLMACVLLSGLCGVAVAAEKKFNHYSIDLPGKCTATEKEGIVTVTCGQDSFFSMVFSRGLKPATCLPGSLPKSTRPGLRALPPPRPMTAAAGRFRPCLVG